MNRHAIATNARSLPGAMALVRADASRASLGLQGFVSNRGVPRPGEGDAASP